MGGSRDWGGGRAVTVWLLEWYRKRQLRKFCFHHDEGGNPANTLPAISWIQQQTIETGKAKMYRCTNCEKTWIP